MPFTGSTSPNYKTDRIAYNVLNLDDSIQEDYGTTSSTTTVICETAWATAGEFLHHMLGYSEKDGNYLKRVLPETCGFNSNQYALAAKLVKSLKWTGNTEDQGWPAYDRVQYSVTFGAPLYQLIEDPQTDRGAFDESTRSTIWSKKGAASNEKIPGSAFYFVDDALSPYTQKPLVEQGVRTGKLVTLEAKWLDVPYVNFAGIRALLGKVNDGPVTWDGCLYETETVLFETWSENKKVNAFGLLTTDITFNFLVRADADRNWNMFWNSVGTIQRVSHNGLSTGNKLFTVGTLENLFKLA